LRGRRGFQIAYGRVGGHFQEIAFLTPGEGSAEPGGATELIVADDPGVREARGILLEEFVDDPDLAAEADLLGNARFLASERAPAPFLGEVETAVDERGAAGSDVGEVDPGLTILDLAQATTPLPLHAHGLGALLGEVAAVEDEDTLGVAQIPLDFMMQLGEHLLVVPEPGPDEVLDEPTILVVVGGDGLAGLSGEVAEKPLHVRAGVSRLLHSVEPCGVAADEFLQVLQARFELLARDFGVGKKFLGGKRTDGAHKTPSLCSPEGFIGKLLN
jgi:hypothetical protein